MISTLSVTGAASERRNFILPAILLLIGIVSQPLTLSFLTLDGFLLFVMGLVIGWRVEMMLRCRRLASDGAAELQADNRG